MLSCQYRPGTRNKVWHEAELGPIIKDHVRVPIGQLFHEYVLGVYSLRGDRLAAGAFRNNHRTAFKLPGVDDSVLGEQSW